MKLRTNKAAAEYSGLPLKLINSVVRQIGEKRQLAEVFLHGADAGYPNFTYYVDTRRCYVNNREEINALVFAQAEELSEDPVQMVLNFRCVAGEAPKTPIRPVEPKAPILPYDVPSETDLPPGVSLEEAVEEALRAKTAYTEANIQLNELINEWSGAPKVLSHDSITFPDLELREAEWTREQAFIAYRKAYVISAMAVHQEQMRRYAEAQAEYKKALHRYEDKLEDYRQARMDRTADQKLIGECLYGGRLTDAHTQICNALAWFALEEVARAVVIDE